MPVTSSPAPFLISNAIQDSDRRCQLAEKIFHLIKNEKNLSLRSPSEINDLLRKNRINCLYIDDDLAGFLVSVPLSRRTIEINGLYIKPEYRGRHYASRLISQVTQDGRLAYFAATFLEPIKGMLFAQGFKVAKLADLSLIERFNFTKQRCKFHRLKEVIRHKKKHPLMLMIKRPQ